MFPIVTSYPALVAINIAAITCIIAVPFIFIVIPRGKINDAISSLTPNSSVTVLVFKGNVAAEDEVENPNKATFPIFFINLIGLSLAPTAIKIAYPNTKNTSNVNTVVITYTSAGFKLSTPYIANVLVIKINIAIGPNFVIIKLKNTVIIEFISSNKVFNTFIFSPNVFIQSPNTTATKTTARILPFEENAAVILFGIACTIINNGFVEFATPACAVTFSIFAVNNPKFLIINPAAPAKANAKTDVDKNPNIVLYEIAF